MSSDLNPSPGDQVDEGKAFGTLTRSHRHPARDAAVARAHEEDPRELKSIRADEAPAQRRALEALKNEVYNDLIGMLKEYFSEDEEEDPRKKKPPRERMTLSRFQAESRKVLVAAYNRVFMAGMRAAGTEEVQRKAGIADLTAEDRKYIKDFLKDEMTHFGRLVDSIRKERWKMPLERRLRMYVDTFDSMFHSAKVLGLPKRYKIFWVSKKDSRVCPSCVYLDDNSPYYVYSLPITPKTAKYLRCVTNCRCQLRFVEMTPSEHARIIATSTKREKLLADLKKIKESGKGRRR